MLSLQASVEQLWHLKDTTNNICRSREACEIIDEVISKLDSGALRLCSPTANGWITHPWVKKAILLHFMQEQLKPLNVGCYTHYDKIAPKTTTTFRSTPPGLVRKGAYVHPSAVLMPSFVNIGAFIGCNTMVDTWATVGSGAQIGNNVHISGGVGIGGVLEPLQAGSVVIEDNCFIGARSEIAEGVVVEANSVISMGVFLNQSTKIFNRITGEVVYGRVPRNSVVVPGNLGQNKHHSLNCVVIVKKADNRTRTKTAVNRMLRI